MARVTDLTFIDAAGFHASDYPTWLAWVQDNFRTIYGTDVYLGADSQDGQWTAILAQAFYDMQNVAQSTYNSYSPTTAQGVGLSRNVKINGLERDNPSHSTVDLTIVGVYGTVITGGIAIDELQQQWSIPTTTIPISGSVVVTATAVEEGAINALSGTINSIFTPTQGWQTVNNVSAATPGAPIETDAQLRTRQAHSTSNPSLTVFEGTLGAVGNVSGVTAFQGYENDTGSTDGNGIPAHSIAIVAQGGLDSAVAQAIQIHKTPGTRTYGTTSVIVYDSRGIPITIHFYRPTAAEIGVEVTVTPLAGWSADYVTQIQDAISASVLAVPIGGTVILTQLYIVAYLLNTPANGTFNVVSIRLKKNAGSFGTANISLLFNEIPTCDPATDVTVVT